eukprot:CAMPEP_0185563196 /NCGR_PEP_ID=MMETSP1381-20130426/62987_1 /TAXON_ID=298111 /ORGANISM="Pavlova sp., Strain CCMP459" /LENGTH=105 /DNA_ID=CAMNT_0028177075 /DNA_START=22 /DNA_END=334 /DNA_ORIENTATION=-
MPLVTWSRSSALDLAVTGMLDVDDDCQAVADECAEGTQVELAVLRNLLDDLFEQRRSSAWLHVRDVVELGFHHAAIEQPCCLRHTGTALAVHGHEPSKRVRQVAL